MLLGRIQAVETQNQALVAMLHVMRGEIAGLREALSSPRDILPLHPIDGIEVIPKREVTIPVADSDGALSIADRLLLNKKARRALEAEEMGEVRTDNYPLSQEAEEAEAEEAEAEEAEAEAEAEEEAEPEAEEEAEPEAEEEAEPEAEAEEEAEPEAEELEEFEYKGATYYRDSDNKVFMTDEDGELVDEPIGTWNPVKNRILIAKTT
jgi:nucleoid-associated protein YgaU